MCVIVSLGKCLHSPSLSFSFSLAKLLNPITMTVFQCDIWDCTSIHCASRVTWQRERKRLSYKAIMCTLHLYVSLMWDSLLMIVDPFVTAWAGMMINDHQFNQINYTFITDIDMIIFLVTTL